MWEESEDREGRERQVRERGSKRVIKAQNNGLGGWYVYFRVGVAIRGRALPTEPRDRDTVSSGGIWCPQALVKIVFNSSLLQSCLQCQITMLIRYLILGRSVRQGQPRTLNSVRHPSHAQKHNHHPLNQMHLSMITMRQ